MGDERRVGWIGGINHRLFQTQDSQTKPQLFSQNMHHLLFLVWQPNLLDIFFFGTGFIYPFWKVNPFLVP